MDWQKLQRVRRHNPRNQANGQIDPENERPMKMLGEETTKHWSHKACEQINACEKDLIFAPFFRCDNIRNDRL